MLDLGGTFSGFLTTLFEVLNSFLRQIFTLLENLLSGMSINLS